MTPHATNHATFALTLRAFRDRRRLSQSRLAETAGFSHSYVSRLESGNRMPTRDAVLKLADVLHLSDTDRDALLAAGGFVPADTASLLAPEPVIVEAYRLLRDTTVPEEIRSDVRSMIGLLVRQALRAAVDMQRGQSAVWVASAEKETA